MSNVLPQLRADFDAIKELGDVAVVAAVVLDRDADAEVTARAERRRNYPVRVMPRRVTPSYREAVGAVPHRA
jgi:hypothetical protein